MKKAWLFIRDTSPEKADSKEESLMEFCKKSDYAIGGVTKFIGTRLFAKATMYEALEKAKSNHCSLLVTNSIKSFTSNPVEFADFLIEGNKLGLELKTADAPEAVYESTLMLRLMLDEEAPVLISTDDDLYPISRELDGMFFRVSRNGKAQSICFTDMTESEQNAVIDNASFEELKRLCLHLADSFRTVAETEDLYNHPEMAMKME